jgi:hypothetical protein
MISFLLFSYAELSMFEIYFQSKQRYIFESIYSRNKVNYIINIQNTTIWNEDCVLSIDMAEGDNHWDYFEKLKKPDGLYAKCLSCSKVLKAFGGSTNSIRSHLKSHKVVLNKRKATDVEPQCSKAKVNKQKITNYFPKKIDCSLEAIISRLIAKDGLPYSKICTSFDLRMLLDDKDIKNVPKSPNKVRNIVFGYADKMRQAIITDISNRLKEGEVFSATMDEWTSVRNRRYMNINIHASTEYWNLGLIRVKGSMPAEKCVDLIGEKLKQFGLSIDQIVAMTTDGASVMKKVGRLIPSQHQICIIHGLHLAIVEVIYNKTIRDSTENDELDDVDDNLVFDDDAELTDTNDRDGFNIDHVEGNESLTLQENGMIGPLVLKIRKIVKLFRQSPVRNDDVLQQNLVKATGKELSLILDIKIRWNSMLDMLERFRKSVDSIRTSLVTLELDISFSKSDVDRLDLIIAALQPVKVAVTALCADDMNLFTADITLKFMLDEIRQQNNELANELLNELIGRIKERRTVWSDVLNYLHSAHNSDDYDYGIFDKTTKATIVKKIIELLEQLNVNKHDHDVEAGSDEDVEPGDTDCSSVTLEQKLYNTITKKIQDSMLATAKAKKPKNLTDIVKKEIYIFNAEKNRGESTHFNIFPIN